MELEPFGQAFVDCAVLKAREIIQVEDDPYGRPFTRIGIQCLVQEIDRLNEVLARYRADRRKWKDDNVFNLYAAGGPEVFVSIAEEAE